MPYKTVQDLPEAVRSSLPKHGEEIYVAAFNAAYEQYKDPADRRDSASREEVAHKVAWSAVNKKYEKNAKGDWVPKT